MEEVVPENLPNCLEEERACSGGEGARGSLGSDGSGGLEGKGNAPTGDQEN